MPRRPGGRLGSSGESRLARPRDGPGEDPWRRIDWAGGRDGGWGRGWGPGVRRDLPAPRAGRRPVRVRRPAPALSSWPGRPSPGTASRRPARWTPPGYLLLTLGPLAWIFLRRRPLVVCAVAVGAASAYLGLGYPAGPVLAGAGLSLVVAVAVRAPVGRLGCVGWPGSRGWLGLGAATGHPCRLGGRSVFAVWLVVLLAVGRGAALPGRAVRRPRAGPGRPRPGSQRAPSAWPWPATCTTRSATACR